MSKRKKLAKLQRRVRLLERRYEHLCDYLDSQEERLDDEAAAVMFGQGVVIGGEWFVVRK